MPCESPALKKQALVTVPGGDTGRKRAGTDPGPGRRPGSGAARAPAGRAALPRAAGFWLVAGVLFLLLFASAAASPLYSVYQAQWRFSATTLTAVFAVYVLVLLLTLLVFGSLSDYLGRRRVIAVALVAGAGACGLFLAAHGIGLLFAARALQGAAVGRHRSSGSEPGPGPVGYGRPAGRRDATAQYQGAVVIGLVVVAVTQHKVAARDQRSGGDLVAGGRAVENELRPVSAEDFRGVCLGPSRGAATSPRLSPHRPAQS
jgi:hypothetical protein